jgi:cobalamin biosynthesis Mg chelatase CobN
LRTVVSAGVIAALAAPAAQAQSGAEQRAAIQVFRDYAPDGRIDPCKHAANELKLAQDNVPPDIEQYAADYPAAIAAALEARARGECDPAKPSAAPPVRVETPDSTPPATPTATAPGAATKTVVPDPPEPETATVAAATATAGVSDAALERVATARASNDAPAPVLLLGLLAVLLALTALLLFAMKRFGVGDDRLAGAAHAIREARWRAAGTWQEFLDWVRLGR